MPHCTVLLDELERDADQLEKAVCHHLSKRGLLLTKRNGFFLKNEHSSLFAKASGNSILLFFSSWTAGS